MAALGCKTRWAGPKSILGRPRLGWMEHCLFDGDRQIDAVPTADLDDKGLDGVQVGVVGDAQGDGVVAQVGHGGRAR